MATKTMLYAGFSTKETANTSQGHAGVVDDDMLSISFGGELLVDGTVPSVTADLEAIVPQ